MENKIDWAVFINKILDDEYALDVKKTGSVSMFTKNQLAACASPHVETGYFLGALLSKITRTSFTAVDSLEQPSTYKILLELGTSFLGSDEFFIRKCSSLYIQLVGFSRPLNTTAAADLLMLQIECSRSLVNFIEEWKNVYQILDQGNIYESHGFLQAVAEKWKLCLLGPEPLNNANVLIGIIYLNEWPALSRNQKKQFFSVNANNKPLLSAVLSDMERVEGQDIYNYASFAEDCKHNLTQFHALIIKRCPLWTSASQEENKVIQENQAIIINFKQRAQSYEHYLSGQALEQNIKTAIGKN